MMLKNCQQHKSRRKYGILPPKQIDPLIPWDTVHIDLIGPYTVGGQIKEIELKLTAMTMVDPATGWFDIAEVPYYSINDVKENNNDYIDKSSARISQIF